MAYDGSQQPSRRRRWSDVEKRRMVDEVEASGLPVSAVARRNLVHPSVLGRWCRQRREKAARGFSLVPVEVAMPGSGSEPCPGVADTAARDEALVEVSLPGGRSLRVRSSGTDLKPLQAAVEKSDGGEAFKRVKANRGEPGATRNTTTGITPSRSFLVRRLV